ncbi:MAG: hypothetical protein GY699_21005 [Desulfobacteraceae bacterium]|nr:hypothetical protein [Desulfobacteraceae bacterium]
MDNILGGQENELSTRIDELDCLIYKNDPQVKNELLEDKGKRVWQTSKENVSVQVWEGKAKIKVKVSPKGKRNISMKRIANVAVHAILEELKKED